MHRISLAALFLCIVTFSGGGALAQQGATDPGSGKSAPSSGMEQRAFPGAVPATPAPGAVESQPVVVELFTSQGCAACPPADAFFGELAQRDNVIALALHVDYWDYIGWSDGFARPEFTRRQKGYAKAAGSRMIYTPQVIVDGHFQLAGTEADHIAAAIETRAAQPPLANLSLSREGDALTIEAQLLAPKPSDLTLQLVRYRPQETVRIAEGENSGRTITYRNIVTSWDTLARWDGQGQLRLTLKVEGQEPAVVIVQQAGPGAILASARVD